MWSNIVFIIFVLSTVSCSADKFETCRSSFGKVGQCLPIRKCESLYDLMRSKPIPETHKELLRKSHCGFDGLVPKVCCFDDTLFINNKIEQKLDDILPPIESDLLPSASDCGIDITGTRIFGGEITELDEFPWMALIKYKLGTIRQIGCAGVLISKRYILTAAHCLRGKMFVSWKPYAVRLGEYNRDSNEDCIYNGVKKECLKTPPIDVEIEEVLVHEGYVPGNNENRKISVHDIGLLRLARDIAFTDYIKPICLPILEKDRLKNYVGENLTVAGWGITERNTRSSIKLKVMVPVKSNTQCSVLYREVGFELTENKICAGGVKGKSACKGDSGGPLMALTTDEDGEVSWIVAGIVSSGSNQCGNNTLPGLYTRVSKYMTWVLKHMKL